MNLIELTRALIDIPSITGEEQKVGQFLNEFLTSLNYSVEFQELESGRNNVIARTSERPRVVLSTHMDTVPPNIRSNEDDEYVYGRGSCDAKGIIAAQIIAAEKLRAEGITEIGLLFTVDEEAGSEGATLANSHPLAASCEFLINGEPTDNTLATGSKGSLRLKLRTTGRAAHSAYPEYGDSAIEKLLDVLDDIRGCDWPSDRKFGETTCNIGTIQGGSRANVIPSEAEALLQIRLTTESALVRRTLEDLIHDRAQVEYLSVSEPVHLLTLDGFESSIVRFTTDIPHLMNWGTPLLIGPGSVLVAHTPDERVSKKELFEAVDLYAQLTRMLLTTARNNVVEMQAEGAHDS